MIVALVVEPVRFPGLMVQLPDGKPLSTTLPVETVQEGWVIVPTTGAEGVVFTVTATCEFSLEYPSFTVT